MGTQCIKISSLPRPQPYLKIQSLSTHRLVSLCKPLQDRRGSLLVILNDTCPVSSLHRSSRSGSGHSAEDAVYRGAILASIIKRASLLPYPNLSCLAQLGQ